MMACKKPVDKDGNTLLHIACWNDNIRAMIFLIEEAGADFGCCDLKGQTPLMLASQRNLQNPIEYLLEKRICYRQIANPATKVVETIPVDLLKQQDYNGNTPLMHALLNCKLNLANLLSRETSHSQVDETILAQYENPNREGFDRLNKLDHTQIGNNLNQYPADVFKFLQDPINTDKLETNFPTVIERFQNEFTDYYTKETLLQKLYASPSQTTLDKAENFIRNYKPLTLSDHQLKILEEERISSSTTLSNPDEEQKTLQHHIDKWNQADAFLRKKAQNKEDLTLKDLNEVNKFCTFDNDKLAMPGVLRFNLNAIAGQGGPSYLAPQYVNEGMKRLIEFMNEGFKKGTNPVILAAACAHIFVSIHPYPDGNGRGAGLLADYILQRSGWPPATREFMDLIPAAFGISEHEKKAFIEGDINMTVDILIKGLKTTYEKTSNNPDKQKS